MMPFILMAQNDDSEDASELKSPEDSSMLVLNNWNQLRIMNGKVLLGCKIARNEKSPGMSEFSRRTQGWAGFAEGVNEPHFIFKSNVGVKECDDALKKAGCRARRQFSYKEALEKMKSGKMDASSYLDGTPVMIGVRWKDNDRIRELPFERFFMEKEEIDGQEIIKPFTPHWIYHGSSLLNDKLYGCFICQQDCSGGLICNNQHPTVKPVPELKPDWSIIPAPGTNVTLVIYILKER